MNEKNEKVQTIRAIAFATVTVAALIVIFAREYAWVIIFTTLIICFFGIATTKNNCYTVKTAVVKEKAKPKKK
jgi:hypothetical protein